MISSLTQKDIEDKNCPPWFYRVKKSNQDKEQQPGAVVQTKITKRKEEWA